MHPASVTRPAKDFLLSTMSVLSILETECSSHCSNVLLCESGETSASIGSSILLPEKREDVQCTRKEKANLI